MTGTDNDDELYINENQGCTTRARNRLLLYRRVVRVRWSLSSGCVDSGEKTLVFIWHPPGRYFMFQLFIEVRTREYVEKTQINLPDLVRCLVGIRMCYPHRHRSRSP